MFAGYYTGVPGGGFFSWTTDYPRGGAEEDKLMKCRYALLSATSRYRLTGAEFFTCFELPFLLLRLFQ